MRVFKPTDNDQPGAGVFCVRALGKPGAGGAFLNFEIDTPHAATDISFMPEPGGVTNEALLSVVRDRLEGFQSGPYACEENARALERVRDAIEYLENRAKRIAAQNAESNSTPQ